MNTPRSTLVPPQNFVNSQTHFAPQPRVSPQFHSQPLPQLQSPQFPMANISNFEAQNFSDASSLMAIEKRDSNDTIETSDPEEEDVSDDAISSDSSDVHFRL